MQRVVKLSRAEMLDMLETGLPAQRKFAIISINDNVEDAELVKALVEMNNPTVEELATIVHPDDCHTSFRGHVENIQNLLDKIKNTDTILIVHCWAGISRSAAVAKFAEEYLDTPVKSLNTYKIYNNVIYNTLQREIIVH